MADVLLFDLHDLPIDPAGERIVRPVPQIHVVVHRLMLGRDERHSVEDRLAMRGSRCSKIVGGPESGSLRASHSTATCA